MVWRNDLNMTCSADIAKLFKTAKPSEVAKLKPLLLFESRENIMNWTSRLFNNKQSSLAPPPFKDK
jgi:hypothetical protein